MRQSAADPIQTIIFTPFGNFYYLSSNSISRYSLIKIFVKSIDIQFSALFCFILFSLKPQNRQHC